MRITDLEFNKLNSDNQSSKKVEYAKPEIEKVVFDTKSTTVLGNCSGWKDSSIKW